MIETDKRESLLELLEEGVVMLHLDARREGVIVPGHLRDDPCLRLNIAYGFNLPALEVDAEGVYAVLSFGGRDFPCTLPWSAVFAMTLPDLEHRGRLWPQTVPPEVSSVLAETADDEAEPPVLEAIEGGLGEDGGSSDDEQAESEAPKRSHLRLVTD